MRLKFKARVRSEVVLRIAPMGREKHILQQNTTIRVGVGAHTALAAGCESG